MIRLLLLLAFSFTLVLAKLEAQSADSLIIDGKEVLRVADNTGDLDRMYVARALFERSTADTVRSAWAHYYLALSDYRIANYLLGQGEEHEDLASTHLKSAVEQLITVTRLDPGGEEAYALLSSVYGRQIGLSPIKGMLLGPRSSRALSKAKQLGPDNPRVVLAAAIEDFHTPEMWGGDKERAMDGYKRAAALFARESPTDPMLPTWGHCDVYAWIGIAHLKKGRHALARRAFEKALDIDPEFGWVKYSLMDKLEKAEQEESR
ncbi:MAG: tetratricopeptide repeat protein [Gemmatimonadota bacterium]|nr:tetratricopeptide repeat protein [Gemmatimonadota bacterium]